MILPAHVAPLVAATGSLVWLRLRSSRRPIAPQLLQWQRRRAATGPPPPRLLRVAPASPDTPQLLVPKAVAPFDGGSLDPRAVFVLALPQHTYVWQVGALPSAAQPWMF